MHIVLAFVGALIATYGVSRVTKRVATGWFGASGTTVFAAHVASWVLIALFVGFLKSYFTAFAFGETIIYAPAQIFWLVIDWLRIADRDRSGPRRDQGMSSLK